MRDDDVGHPEQQRIHAHGLDTLVERIDTRELDQLAEQLIEEAGGGRRHAAEVQYQRCLHLGQEGLHLAPKPPGRRADPRRLAVVGDGDPARLLHALGLRIDVRPDLAVIGDPGSRQVDGAARVQGELDASARRQGYYPEAPLFAFTDLVQRISGPHLQASQVGPSDLHGSGHPVAQPCVPAPCHASLQGGGDGLAVAFEIVALSKGSQDPTPSIADADVEPLLLWEVLRADRTGNGRFRVVDDVVDDLVDCPFHRGHELPRVVELVEHQVGDRVHGLVHRVEVVHQLQGDEPPCFW